MGRKREQKVKGLQGDSLLLQRGGNMGGMRGMRGIGKLCKLPLLKVKSEAVLDRGVFGKIFSLLLITSFSFMMPAKGTTGGDLQSREELIARGQYLAEAADCLACHQGEGRDEPPYVGGHVIDSPIGQIVATNITPSKEFGIGHYSEQQFKDALTKGVRADGKGLYPAMPYTSYRAMSDEDLHALYTYFMYGVEPVDRKIPETKLSFPFSLRFMVKNVGLLFAQTPPDLSEMLSDSGRADEEERLSRGQYIVDTLGHCGMCHTPRNLFMAEDNRNNYLAGGMIGAWYAPNITSDPISGIGAWSEEELLHYFRVGNVPGKGQAGGEMSKAVEHGLRFLSDGDLKSVVAYLKQVPPIATQEGNRASFEYSGAENPPEVIYSAEDARLYASACASCHRLDGKGAYDNHFPSLAYNSAVGHNIPNNLVMAIIEGVDRKSEAGYAYMPAFGEALSDGEIAMLVNYISDHFGNPDVKVTESVVKTLRNGGERPIAVTLAPVLAWGGIGLGVLVLLLLGGWLLRRKS